MEIKSTDLVSLFEQSLKNELSKDFDEIGIVIQVGDGICKIFGLVNAIFNEMVEFDGGNKGIILDLEQDHVTVFLLSNKIPTVELEVVKRTGRIFNTPVGKNFLGRVVNVVGVPLDGLGAIEAAENRSIENVPPGVVERSSVNRSLETGILAIDSLVPIGKGQRELLIGNRNTGKTSIALDTILHQKGKDVICIYVSIGQRQANLARTIRLLLENDALEYTIIISADSGDSVLTQYLAPYVGCTMGEYFKDQNKDVLIVYDDLSNHAVAYREMSLLMRRPPGREAYPGDVFYLHSRLLERAGNFINGGSITALPIIQIQADDITAYIPTNLISITDGQIFLDDQLFKSGIRPAVNFGLSISRIGGAAQTKVMKKTVKTLGLELAQYRELIDFSQFGTELDKEAQSRLTRGEKAIALLKQPQYTTYSFVDQVLMLFLLRENFLDIIESRDVNRFAVQFANYVESIYESLYNHILESKDVSDEIYQKLIIVAQEYNDIFVAQKPEGIESGN